MYLRDLSMPDILKLFSTEAEKKVYLFRNKKQHYNLSLQFLTRWENLHCEN